MTASEDRLRFLGIMELVLGHRTQYQNLRRVIDARPDVDARWGEVTFWKEDEGLVERFYRFLKRQNLPVRGILQAREAIAARPAPDALLVNSNIAVFFPGLLRRTTSFITTDTTPAQYDREMAPGYGKPGEGRGPAAAFKRAAVARAFRAASGFIVWSAWCARSVEMDYGIPADRIHVIPPGVAMDLLRPGGCRAESPLPRVLFVGGQFRRKGGDLLLEAFRGPLRGRARLVLVTRDPVEPEEGVEVHRGLSAADPRLVDLFRTADVFALPSRAECFGIALVEAQAAGLPVITTCTGGVPELVAEGETGFVVPPGDGAALAAVLLRLVGDAPLRRRMGEAARARAERLFDRDRNANRTLDVIREAARGIPAGRLAKAPAIACLPAGRRR